MKDMDDSDWWGALAQASDAEDVQQEGSGVEPDFSVSDLLRNAGEATLCRTKLTRPILVRQATSQDDL